MNASMDAELAVSSVSTVSWETEAINERMVGREPINIGTVSGLKRWLAGLYKAFHYPHNLHTNDYYQYLRFGGLASSVLEIQIVV